jgi:hypothetical protein
MRVYKYLLTILIVSAFRNPADAKFLPPTFSPVERLIANTTAYVKENPEMPHGYYILGRIHYLAFVKKASLVTVWRHQELGIFLHQMIETEAIKITLKEFGYSSLPDIPEKDRPRFWDAVRKKRNQLEQECWRPAKGKKLNEKVKADRVPEELRSVILNRAKDIYYTAYKLSIKSNLNSQRKPLTGLGSLVGYEAGKAYIRLSEADALISENEADRIARVRKDLKKLEGLPPGPITPIIFSLEEHRSLSDLLAPDLQVRFDLNGDGVVELWPWVKPTTGILVWDPDGKGSITSGRQLFGSVSWWLFFADGYHALDALDDNRDGMLSGNELVGISVWFDHNCDGKSDFQEVIPLAKLPITSLATKSSGKDRGCRMNTSGLTLTDSRTLPTYDWLASPVKRP